MFKKNAEEEEGEEEERRRLLRPNRSSRTRSSVGVSGAGSVEPRYDEEYYNNLISQQQRGPSPQQGYGGALFRNKLTEDILFLQLQGGRCSQQDKP